MSKLTAKEKYLTDLMEVREIAVKAADIITKMDETFTSEEALKENTIMVIMAVIFDERQGRHVQMTKEISEVKKQT